MNLSFLRFILIGIRLSLSLSLSFAHRQLQRNCGYSNNIVSDKYNNKRQRAAAEATVSEVLH